MTPPLPNAVQDAARALGKERFEYFTTQLARRLVGGKNMTRDVQEDISATESEFFTEAEIDALRSARVEGAAEPDSVDSTERDDD